VSARISARVTASAQGYDNQNCQKSSNHPLAILALPGLWRVISEPTVTPPEQNFALRHVSVIHAALTPQGNRYWMTFRVFHVTGFQVIVADRDSQRHL